MDAVFLNWTFIGMSCIIWAQFKDSHMSTQSLSYLQIDIAIAKILGIYSQTVRIGKFDEPRFISVDDNNTAIPADSVNANYLLCMRAGARWSPTRDPSLLGFILPFVLSSMDICCGVTTIQTEKGDVSEFSAKIGDVTHTGVSPSEAICRAIVHALGNEAIIA